MKNVVEVSKSQLNAIYRAASTDVKDMMKNMFPNVVGLSAMDRIKTWQDVCEELNINQESWNQMVNARYAACPMTTGEAKCAIAHMKVLMIAKVLNEGWELTKEAEDNSEGYGIYWLKRDGVRGDVDFQASSICAPGFVGATISFGYSSWDVVPRLSFKTRALAEYAVLQFPDIWREYYNNYEQVSNEAKTC